MKLYLASKHIEHPAALVSLVNKKAKDTSVLLVVNAFDNYPTDRRMMHVSNLTNSLKAAGYTPTQLDLREYFSKTDELIRLLKGTDLLWISGGNVFYLRYVLRKCGLDSKLGELIDNGLVYGGDSAGAVIIGGNMHGFELLDDPAEAPDVIYKGLGITAFIIIPHWGNERYKDEIGQTKVELEKHNKEVVMIGDHQACVVDGRSRRILG